MNRQSTLAISCVLLLGVCSGAGCPMMQRTDPMHQPPVVFQETASLDQLIAHVNGNTAKVQSLESTGASVSVKGFPAARANLYMVPPKRFRLIAETSLTGQLLDLGSNDQEFWLWGKMMNLPGQLYARHDQFQYTAARQMMPVEPHWVSYALGLVTFEPTDQHEGPRMTNAGHYEIRSQVSSGSGPLTKVTIIDRSHGNVLEQHVYDAQGTTLVSAMASNHRFDVSTGVTLPYKVDIRLPQSGLDFSVSVIGYRINQMADTQAMFQRPERSDVRSINLADPHGMAAQQPTMQSGIYGSSDASYPAAGNNQQQNQYPVAAPYSNGNPSPTEPQYQQPSPYQSSRQSGYPVSMGAGEPSGYSGPRVSTTRPDFDVPVMRGMTATR
ncbi:MAG: hypothetical protein WEE51_05655 [Pirellulaceae bacterium]